MFDKSEVRNLNECESGEVRGAIEEFFRAGEPDDTLLLYYSGHGRTHYQQLFLCAQDTNVEKLHSTAIAGGMLKDIVSGSLAQVKILILDCCYSAMFKGAEIAEEFAGTGRYVIAAASATERASDGQLRGQPSPFTKALADALHLGAADHDGDGLVDLDDVYNYLDAVQFPGARPHRKFDGAGAIPIARRAIREHGGGPRPADPVPDAAPLREVTLSGDDAAVYAIEAQSDLPYLDRIVLGASFSQGLVDSFRAQMRADLLEKMPARLPAAQFLQQAGLMRRGRLTYAGLLLFGENPTTYLPAAIVQCVRFYGTTATAPVETIDLQGSVPELIVKARDFIADLARTGELPTADGAYAQAAYRYPMVAVREIIANAIVHRDYSDQESCVQIRAFDDRIEILNPGKWAGASAMESGQLLLGQLERRSAKRNFRLAQTLTWSKLVEGVSAGVPRSIADCESNGAPEPTVAMDERMVQVTIFPRPSLALDRAATGLPRSQDVDRVTSPAGRLLDQITEVIEVSYPGARMRRIESPDGLSHGPPHLLVTHIQDGFTRQWRVAAHVGEVTLEVIEAFAAPMHPGGPEASAEPANAELVCSGPRPGQVLRAEALRLGIRVRSFTEFQGLLDLRDYVADQAARLQADQRYPHALYVPQRFRDLEAQGSGQPGQPAGNDLVGEVLDELARDAGRFVLLLADFGRGKTFALRELARRIPEQLPHLIPIYIELRSLDKAHSVDGLIAAHLANHGEERIDLRAFRYMLAQGRIVLLFDGFDELATRVTFDRAADHLQTLLSAARDKAKIIVASRTQHFKSDEQVFTALGERVGLLPGMRMLGVEDFDDAQISAYLRNWYGQEDIADERLQLLRNVESLLGLSGNPRMLSFIAQLNSDRLHAVAAAGRALSGAALYAEILDSWLRYEHERAHGIPGAPAGLTLEDLWRAVTVLAMRLNESGETLIRLSDLADELSPSLAELSGGPLTAEQRVHAIGSGTLLVRGEDETFGFIHPSVAEWLVANEIARLLSSGEGAPREGAEVLARRPLSQLTVDFLCDLADPQALSRWMSGVLEDSRAGSVARANALRVGSRLRVSTHTDLRGARLRGEDLSHRDLAAVDFTGADLTRARLVGTNLSGAVLASARLADARLDGARLTRADLSGADLSGARLTRADLSGVRLDGSTWNRAALIDVRSLPPGADQLPELDGAAIAPGQPVVTEIAPSEIGVPYGYHEQYARLPQPLAYSGDGALLAIGDSDGGVTLCDTGTGLPVRTLRGHRGRVYGTAYGAGDGILVTASSDATIRLWDTATGEATRVIEVEEPGAWPAEVSPDGRYLTYGAPDGIVRLLDIASGSVALELPGHVAPVYTVAFGDVSPGEPIVITGDRAGTVRVWEVATGALRARFTIPRGPVYRLLPCPGAIPDRQATDQQAPDQQATVFAAGGAAGALLLLDAGGIALAEFPGHTGSVYALAYHPGRRLLASGCTDGGVRLWDLAKRTQLRELDTHPGALYGLSFSPDGELLASASNDGLVRLTSVPEGRARHELTAHKSAVWRPLFSPDGTQIATSSNDGTCRLWDTASGQPRHLVRGHGRRVTSVTFSSDGELLAAGGNDGMVRVWNAAAGQQRHALTGTGDRLVSAVFGPEPGLLAAASNDGGVYLWNAATGVQEREMNVETERVWAETFSPDGEVLATANDDDSVRLWYRSTGRNTLTITDHRGRVRSLAFSPAGLLLATGCDDRGVRVWDTGTGELRASMEGHRDRVYSVAFSPSGELLASAGNDGAAFLWDPATGAQVRRIDPGAGKLWTTAFSPSGEILATGGDDGIIRLWSVPGGDLLHELTGHADRVAAVAFSPASSPGLLASASDDGTVRLWSLGDGFNDGGAPAARMTLLGVDAGWAAFSPDGRYKYDGVITGQFWHAIGTCRFEPGELDPDLPAIQRLPADAPF